MLFARCGEVVEHRERLVPAQERVSANGRSDHPSRRRVTPPGIETAARLDPLYRVRESRCESRKPSRAARWLLLGRGPRDERPALTRWQVELLPHVDGPRADLELNLTAPDHFAVSG